MRRLRLKELAMPEDVAAVIEVYAARLRESKEREYRFWRPARLP